MALCPSSFSFPVPSQQACVTLFFIVTFGCTERSFLLGLSLVAASGGPPFVVAGQLVIAVASLVEHRHMDLSSCGAQA